MRKGWTYKLIDSQTEEVLAVSHRYKTLEAADKAGCIAACELAAIGEMVESHIYRPDGTLDHAHHAPRFLTNYN